MKQHLFTRLLSLLMVIALLAGFALPVGAAETGDETLITITKVDNSEVSVDLRGDAEETTADTEPYAPTDMVRVSIFLNTKSTIDSGFSTEEIALNDAAMAYRDRLESEQANITASIEKATGRELDVVWNLTLAANVISANVPYGQIETIESIQGVSEVLIETCYEPMVLDTDYPADPNMATSSEQIGSAAAWAAGYTGAGSRIAVIDTGADTDHISLSAAGFLYSLEQNAAKLGMSKDAYMASLKLLTADEIEKLSGELNASTGAESYINEKIAYGYNYVDKDLDVTHDNDEQGSHGSHVSGIATANSYVYVNESYLNALESAKLQGVAPDAQLLSMKVFGKTGGAYDSDYMAAIEDAIVLGCDVANLSLGTAAPGNSRHATPAYQEIMENLTKAGMVVTISAGNSGSWVTYAENGGYLYSDDANMSTTGAPGSFTNSLAVASVDNDGTTGYYVSVGGNMIVYNDSEPGEFTNEPFITLAGDHEYVFIDGFGTAEEFAAVGEALKGKIAVCSRGEISFYLKAQYAVEAGAIATIIYDNQPGIVNMDLTDYPYTQPAVSLTQKDGNVIRENSTPVKDEEGNILYYTGTMTVSSTLGTGQYESEYYTMSDFSSWGVPGSLQMKPEITAPGGLIFSIEGTHPSGTAYEVNSGTSMAAPQVAGMSAVMGQYVREAGLVEKTGLSERQLIQSLLMSTAVPLLSGENTYYPVIQQGAGLANVSDAISADSYITMAPGSSSGDADGKVKVELGEDADRKGDYSATFTIHNLTNEEKIYELSADFFIQAPISDGETMYMDFTTALIGADLTWYIDGVEVVPVDMDNRDVNGDGKVNSDDGQAILNYATGLNETIDTSLADLDSDNDVDTHDAYLFLKALGSGVTPCPANGSIEVTVNFKLSRLWKDAIEAYYPNGTYIQGYIFAESKANDEGIAGTSHSIPVLGFYGSWTDPSMFDVGSWPEFYTGQETRMPYVGITRANDFKITYDDDPLYYYSFSGNPIIPDDVYRPERNAINSKNYISGLTFLAIRGAAASRFQAVNETTGEVLRSMETGPVAGAYFHEGYGMWQNTGSLLETPVSLTNTSEGDVITMGLTLAPEYYVDSKGNVNWDELGEGATFSMSMTVDNTAPVLYEASFNMLANTITVTASDNEYVAAVGLFNKTGTQIRSAVGSKSDIEKGEIAEYTFSLDEVNGKKFLLQVIDYAENKATYLVEMQIGEPLPLPEMIGFDMNKVVWTYFTKDFEYDYKVGLPVLEDSDYIFYAATIAEHYIFATTSEGDLFVMPEDDLSDMTYITTLDTLLVDMAYNKADGNIYAVDEFNNLVTFDKLSGVVEKVGSIGVTTNTLACDAEGTFYCNGLGTGAVYSFTLDSLDNPTILVEDVGIQTEYIQSMEINPNTGMLCWNSFFREWGVIITSYYYEIDPKTGEFTQYADFWHEISCLCIPEKSSVDNSWTEPTTIVTGVTLNRDSLDLLKGGTAELTANVNPWTAVDRTVTWSTSNPEVATVTSKGLVTANGLGTATITATSNLDPNFSASCTVNVSLLEVTFEGTLLDDQGVPHFYTWNMAETDSWVAGNEIDVPSITSVTYSEREGVYYIVDAETDHWNVHKVGADGKTIETAVNPNGIPLWDSAYATYFSEKREKEQAAFIYYYYLLSPKDPMKMDAVGFNLSSIVSYMTGITSLGYETMEDEEGIVYDTEHFVMVDNLGTIWDFWIYDEAEGGGMGALYAVYPSDLPCEFLGDETMDNMFTSLKGGNDGALYLSTYTGITNELYRIVFDPVDEMYRSTYIGDMGNGVWPATITSVTANNIGTNAISPEPTDYMAATVISEEELAKASIIHHNTLCTITAEDEAAKAAQIPEKSTVTPGKTVTVTVTAEDVAHNGLVYVNWDLRVLELKSLEIHADYAAQTDIDEGIAFGYVSLNGIPAGEPIATLTLEPMEQQETYLVVTQLELNGSVGGYEEFLFNFEHNNTKLVGAKEATCTEDGYTGDLVCEDCGEVLEQGEVIPATGHTEVNAPYTAPTCTTDGYSGGKHCATCGEVLVAGEVIPATGHTVVIDEGVAPTCESEGRSDGSHCSACGMILAPQEHLPATGHAFGPWIVEKLATETEDGKIVRTCENCGLTETEILPATGSNLPAECPSEAFSDLDTNSWYHEGVDFVLLNGLMNGMSSTEFAPNGVLTRAQLVTILYRMAGSPSVDGLNNPFTDVPTGTWYTNAVIWAADKGVVTGTTATTFAPDVNITREQIATILFRYAGAEAVAEDHLADFTDADKISGYAKNAMNWAVANGLINGMGDGTVAPNATATRAQIATILMRYSKTA